MWEKKKSLFFPTMSAEFLAHMSTTCSGWAIVIDHRLASVHPCVRTSLNNYLKNLLLWTGQHISMKLQTNDLCVMHFQNTSKIWIPWRTLVAMATKRKNLKIFLSQTVWARAFIFGMLHHLVALYQNTSNYGPRIEISPYVVGSWISHWDKERKF